jgi:hypothetical protein
VTPTLRALGQDAEDLAALLHVLAEAAAQRCDEDARRTLRLAARQAEGIVERVEELGAKGDNL